jgi:hypothetical protein
MSVRITTTRCVITHKSAVLSYFMVESSNHTHLPVSLLSFMLKMMEIWCTGISGTRFLVFVPCVHNNLPSNQGMETVMCCVGVWRCEEFDRAGRWGNNKPSSPTSLTREVALGAFLDIEGSFYSSSFGITTGSQVAWT